MLAMWDGSRRPARRGRCGRPRRAPGFTLLELLVVMFMVVLFSGVAVVSLRPAMEDARLRSGARIVISALRYARSHAVAQRADTAVVFDIAQQGVSVESLAVHDDGSEEWHPVTTQAGRFHALPARIVFAGITTEQESAEDGTTTITFTALGSGEDAEIILTDAKGIQRIIRVDAVTGQCELVSETHE